MNIEQLDEFKMICR